MSQAKFAIRNATIVDGTGAAAFKGDVAVDNGKIAAVGKFDGSAEKEIDAGGHVLSPGFIDVHTHFDPQLCWDRLATPSLEHGVTSVVVGNCSLSLAPVRAGASRKLIKMFGKIEDIKEPTFDAGVPFKWESFGQYLDFIKPGLGINVGALVGHSALRYYVMGAESQERIATDDEIKQMCDLLEGAMSDGAIGMSTSYVDIDENNRPVPSRLADMREKIALCKAMAKSGRGTLQTVPYFIDPVQHIKNIEELAELSLASGVFCTVAPIVYSPAAPEQYKRYLEKLDEERARGAKVFGQSMTRSFNINIRLSETSFLLYGLPSWNAIMQLPVAERVAAFADPASRQKLVTQAERGIAPMLHASVVGEVYSKANEELKGRRLSEIAKERGQPISDVMLDIAVADDLQTEFQLNDFIHADANIVAQILDHPSIHIGASDAGAHVAQFCGAGDTSDLLARFVREFGKLKLERAIHRITAEPADAWGIRNRGRIAVGAAADLTLFDPTTIARGEEVFVHDFPGGGNRYIRHARGIDKVIVNGELVVDNGKYTDARAGQII
ncbi:MAG TPA: amidohydrolase family protein [Candidatus Binataceae bacterium]|nr:amidohydrolase family protein [Candidatus Binataceae bacterium]